MKVYQSKPKQVEHAIRWEGENTLEIEEALSGYGYIVKQYGDSLYVGVYIITLGCWVVVDHERGVSAMDEERFNEQYEEVEI